MKSAPISMSSRKPHSTSSEDGAGVAVTITAVEPTAADPTMRRLKAGRRTLGTIHAEEVESLRLRPGSAWTGAVAEAVQRLTMKRAARKEAMRALGRRACSSQSMLERLVRHGVVDSIAADVVRDLVRDGWMNDEALAADLAGSAARKPGASRALVEGKLVASGLPTALVHRAVEAAMKDGTAIGQAIGWARRHWGGRTGEAARSKSRRIAAGLARRGFDEDTIAAALDQLGLSVDDPPLELD